jgi:citrate lyase subunit beta/citryl-CoA lyase
MHLLRSLLLVPALTATAPDFTVPRGPDALVIDLHESVPVPRLPEARAALRDALPRLIAGPVPVWVRVNATQELLAKDDIRAAVAPGLAGIILPRVTGQNHVRYSEALLRDAEQMNGVEEGKTALIAVIESAAGLLNALEIGRASARLAALAFGAEEYCADLGVERSRGGAELSHARGQIAVCARVAGLPAIDTPFPDTYDEAALRADAEAARLLGFHGKLALSPAQAALLNGLFRPTAESLEYARRIVLAHDEAAAAAGPLEIDGRVVGRAATARARRLVELATAIEAREGQSSV